jgi:hypothetical protein
MASQLSWDLHVHPGPSAVPRWGTGAEIRTAAARAGLNGFVWKSHDRHTARACHELPPGPPWAIGSASLNAWATTKDVAEAVEDGARWVWGPTHREGKVDWDRPLPDAWPTVAELLRASPAPLVLGTGHLAVEGRRAFAELASSSSHLVCSVTHSLYLARDEVVKLRDLGCFFEVDLYTATHPIAGRPAVDLASGIRALRDLGATVYITTDAGQLAVGDPYVFSRATLASLAGQLGDEVLEEVAVRNPDRVAAHARGRGTG